MLLIMSEIFCVSYMLYGMREKLCLLLNKINHYFDFKISVLVFKLLNIFYSYEK